MLGIAKKDRTMNRRDLTKYAYQPYSGATRVAYRAYRYSYHDGKMQLHPHAIAIVMREYPSYWIATLARTGLEICVGHGPTRDKAIDDALATIGES